MMKQTSLQDGALFCDPNDSPTLTKTLERILETVIVFTQSQAACLAFLDESSHVFCKVFATGLSDHFMHNMVFRTQGLADETFRTHNPIVSNDRPETPHKLSQLVRDEGLTSFICLPLMNAHHHLGLLYVYQGQRDDYPELETKLLQSYAFLATSAISAELEIRERRIAEQRAARESQAKSDFLANMSHEIRTPMNGVLGMLSLLKQAALPPEQQEFVHIAYSSAEALLTLLNDILDISKIEAGKLCLETVDFQLRHVVESVIETMAVRANEKHVELSCLITPAVPHWVKGDPTRLRQILLNLVGNAIKFTSEGDVTVNIHPLTNSATHDTLQFNVTDTGIGIPKDLQPLIFRAFEQATESTTRKFGGTGLGLAICQQLTEKMGGDIGVTSTPGEGSTFHVNIPLSPPSETHEQDDNLLDLHTFRALIVGDKRHHRHSLEAIFNSWQLPFDCVDRGRLAVEQLAQAQPPYDLVVIEQNLPDMQGLEVAKNIQRSQPKPMKMILLCSFGQRGDGYLARQAGISAYMTKPIRYGQLRDCLLLVLQQETAHAERLITKHSITERQHLKRARLLLVEDDLFNQKVALTLLRKLGFQADIASTGVEAVAAVTHNAYDLVLMDCQMPEMDGFEATQRIRQHPSSKTLPIIAMTAHALPGDRQRCIAAGMDDYLAKPVVLETLREKLLAWLSADVLTAPPTTASNETDPPLLPFLSQLQHKIGHAFYRVIEIYIDDQEDALCTLEKRILLKQARQRVTQQTQAFSEEEQQFIRIPEHMAKMAVDIRTWCEQQNTFLEDLVTTEAEKSHPPPEAQTINPETHRILQENLEETYAQTLDIFLQDVPKRLTEISNALTEGDLIRVKRAAHSLKGGCRYLGAERMAAQCLHLEETAELGQADNSQQLLTSIRTLFDPVKVVLESQLSLNKPLNSL